MSPLTFLPVLVLAGGALAVSWQARRIRATLRGLDDALLALDGLERSRVGLADEIDTVANRDFLGTRRHR